MNEPGVIIIELDATTTIDEDGTSDTYTISLNNPPTAPVTISVTTATQ